ncbi:MAG TPA: hypothetical protein VEU09_02475, partial [Candidatus Binatia bacterium]|nr:hypothetical protein [Candidatus Binatia bacterium]
GDSSMVRIFLRIVLAILLVRFLGGLFRGISGGSQKSGERLTPRPPRPLVDRSSVIDVPFTEERREG